MEKSKSLKERLEELSSNSHWDFSWFLCKMVFLDVLEMLKDTCGCFMWWFWNRLFFFCKETWNRCHNLDLNFLIFLGTNLVLFITCITWSPQWDRINRDASKRMYSNFEWFVSAAQHFWDVP
jgi:hypothetical protein